MLRVFYLLCLLFLTAPGWASTPSTRYQIDLILFTHAYTPHEQLEQHPSEDVLTRDVNVAIPLRPLESNESRLYRLLPTSLSSLRNAWSRLNQQSQYQPLLHYTWIQPSNNQHPIHIMAQANNGWNINGTLRVRQSNYYLLDTELHFTAPNHQKASFMFTQKQRLKPGNTYYLDHPQGGMLINVHQVA